MSRLFGAERVTRERPNVPAAEHAVLTYGGSTIVAPLQPAVARASVALTRSDDTGWPERIVRRVAWLGARTGIVNPLLRQRVWVDTESDESLHAHLGDQLGTPVVVAAAFGPNRPNQKPVLRVMDRSGNLLAFVKVAWNPLTRRLIEDEGAALERLATLSSDLLVWPTVIARSQWHGYEILVTTPVEVGGRADDVSMVAATSAVAALGERTVGSLPDLPFWVDVAPALSEAHRQVLLERCGGVPVRCGFSHGDWTPWNMSAHGDRLSVWDWERATDGVPLGLDAVHFEFQRRLRQSMPASTAAQESVTAIERAGYDLAVADPTAMVALYAAWIARRFVDSDPVPGWVDELLRTSIEQCG